MSIENKRCAITYCTGAQHDRRTLSDILRCHNYAAWPAQPAVLHTLKPIYFYMNVLFCTC